MVDRPLLRVENLAVAFRTRRGTASVLNGVSFEVGAGEVLGIVGESGSGKSITSLAVMGLVPGPHGRISDGRILFRGEDLAQADEARLQAIRGASISMIFQEPMTSLNPVFTIGEQIGETLRFHEGLSRREARVRAFSMLKAVQIPAAETRLDSYPHELSGGMRQRVMIAMALACKPDLLIADEPTTALDVTVQAEIFELLRKIGEESGAGIILITHDMGAIAEMADRVLVMYAGHVVETGSVDQVLNNPAHPYTQGLIACVPHIRKDLADTPPPLTEIPGMVPPFHNLPPGCPFAPRCPHRFPPCTVAAVAAVAAPPALRELGHQAVSEPDDEQQQEPSHRVACHLYDEQHQMPQASKPTGGTQVAAPPALRELGYRADRETNDEPHHKPEASKPSGGTQTQIEGLEVHFPLGKAGFFAPRRVVRAVDGVSFAVAKGSCFGLVGESGSGKSTVALASMRLVRATAGRVLLAGEDILGLEGEALRSERPRFQIVFQDPYSSLNPRRRAGQIVREPMDLMAIGSKDERAWVVSELFSKVGLRPEQQALFPHQFSGGQRQRIAIARALATKPDLLILDEPVSALDVAIQAQILNLLKKLQEELGLTFLFISHDLGVVQHMCDRIGVMYLGRIVEEADRRQLFGDPKHPYTQALLQAVPSIERRKHRTAYVKSDPPSPIDPPSGCHFHPRCPKAEALCKREMPTLREDDKGHLVACHFATSDKTIYRIN